MSSVNAMSPISPPRHGVPKLACMPAEIILNIFEHLCGDVLPPPTMFVGQGDPDFSPPFHAVLHPDEDDDDKWHVESKTPDTTTIDPFAAHHVCGTHENGVWGGFEHRAALSVDNCNRRRRFRALSLTSRRMRALAQPFLYDAVVVDSPNLPLLARTLATPNCLHLAKVVRSLCLMAPPCRARTMHEFENSHPAWRDPDVISMAAAYSVEPPSKKRGRTCADMLAFEAKLLAISTAVVLKNAPAIKQFRVVPLADAKLAALPCIPFSKEISLSLSPASTGLGAVSVLSVCIDRALLDALPLVSPRLHSGVTHRFPTFREFAADGYSQYHDLMGVVQLVAAAKDVQTVSCLGPRSQTDPWWVMERGATDRFPSRGPLTSLSSLDLTECQLKPQALIRVVKSCPSLKHLRVHFAEGFNCSATGVLGRIQMEDFTSRLTSLDIRVPTVIRELFEQLDGSPDSHDMPEPLPILPTMAVGFDNLEYLDMPASAIWCRPGGPGTVLDSELDDTQRLVEFLPRKLRTLALRGILAVPAVQLEALADECGRRGRFPRLRSVLMEGPTPLLAEYGGDMSDFAMDEEDAEPQGLVCTGSVEKGENVMVARALEHSDDCKCPWGEKLDRQRPALERVQAKFEAKGVQFKITQGYLWSAAADDEDAGDGPSEDGDVEMVDNMEGLTEHTKAWLTSNGLA